MNTLVIYKSKQKPSFKIFKNFFHATSIVSIRELAYIMVSEYSKDIKIGVTGNICNRVAEVRRASGKDIKEIYVIPGTKQEVLGLEKLLHIHFKTYQRFGEWFKLDAKDVLKYLGNNFNYVLKNLDEEQIDEI